MLLIRDIMYCKPGKVRAMAEKFVALSKLGQKYGMPPMRVMTDVCAERYWTVISEMEVPNLQAYEDMTQGMMSSDSEAAKKFGEIMKDYHDLIVKGRREIYRIEG